MAKIQLGLIFVVVCLLGRIGFQWIGMKSSGNLFILSQVLNPWFLFVVATTATVGFCLGYLRAKGRFWITALISALVATLMYVPALWPMIQAREKTTFVALAFTFGEWFALGLAGHLAAGSVEGLLKTRTAVASSRNHLW